MRPAFPVAFVRGRATASEHLRIEGVVAPVFRRGVFDRLGESSSPFNLVSEGTASLPGLWGRERREPRVSLENVSGGGRVELTAGQVDVALSGYRGFDGIGPAVIEVGEQGPLALPAPVLVEHHPRFTMLGADFETVVGPWAWRGEAALFTERTFARATGVGLVRGRSADVGIGLDRRVAEFRVFASTIVHREWSDLDREIDRTDVSVVGSIERAFGRERYLGRAFAVVNPRDEAAFLRGLMAWRPRDQMSLEASAGAFLGTASDAIGRFRTRDFVLGSVRVWLW